MSRYDDWDEVITIDPDRRWVLRAAFEASGLSLSAVARAIDCKHPTVRALLYEPEQLGATAENARSTKLYTRLCLTLHVPLWMVVKGIRPEQRNVIEALERLRGLSLEKYDELIKATIETAEDKAVRAGWKPEEATGEPSPPKRRPPKLRPVP